MRFIKAARWWMPLLLIVPTFAGTISVQPSSLTVVPGQNFSVNVSASSVADLYGYQFDLGFNPTVLSATSISEGSFLPGAGATFFLPGTISNVAGNIAFTADSLVGAIPGVTGSGTLATVNFKAMAAGTSAVTLSNATLLDSKLATITAGSANGSVSVSGVPEPSTWTMMLLSMVLIAGYTRLRGGGTSRIGLHQISRPTATTR